MKILHIGMCIIRQIIAIQHIPYQTFCKEMALVKDIEGFYFYCMPIIAAILAITEHTRSAVIFVNLNWSGFPKWKMAAQQKHLKMTTRGIT